MARSQKQSLSPSRAQRGEGTSYHEGRESRAEQAREYGTFKDRNLAAMDPLSGQESLKPTDAEPVNMHKRMAGCS